jgi:hypothetical protein
MLQLLQRGGEALPKAAVVVEFGLGNGSEVDYVELLKPRKQESGGKPPALQERTKNTNGPLAVPESRWNLGFALFLGA